MKNKKRKAREAKRIDNGNILAAVGAVALVGLGIAGAILAGRRRDDDDIDSAKTSDDGEHIVDDLALDKPHKGPADRAPKAFSPDRDAPVSAAEREAFKPATFPVPKRGPVAPEVG